MTRSDYSLPQYLSDQVELDVRAGFKTGPELLGGIRQRVIDELGHADDVLVLKLSEYLKDLLGQELTRQASWTEPTVNDAIDVAFAELNGRGICAMQNVGYTMSEGWQRLTETASSWPSPPRGAVFYHGQDLEHAVRGRGLTLAFSAYGADVAKQDQASIVIAVEACETLLRNGVPVQWDGTVEQRLEIPGFEWRKRR